MLKFRIGAIKAMPPLSEQILRIVQVLPEKDQRQILDFSEFLRSQQQQPVSIEIEATPQSFLEAAKEVIGMGEGPGELSTNPAYMQGYGQ